MSKYIKRLGTKGFKYQIEVSIYKVQTDLKENCQLFVQWQRGPHKVETRRANLDQNSGLAFFTDRLHMPVTLYYDSKAKKYLDKKSKLKVLISNPKANQPLGECDINLASYPNLNITEKDEKMNLTRYTNNFVELTFNIKATLLSEVTMNDSAFSGSERGEVSADEDVAQETSLRVNTQQVDTGEKHMSYSASPYQRNPKDFNNILPESPSYSEIQQRRNQGGQNKFPLPVPVSNISPSNKENSTVTSNEQKKGESAFNKLFEGQNAKFKVKRLPPRDYSQDRTERSAMMTSLSPNSRDEEQVFARDAEALRGIANRLKSKERDVSKERIDLRNVLEIDSESINKRNMNVSRRAEQVLKDLKTQRQMQEDNKDEDINIAKRYLSDKAVGLTQMQREIEGLKEENEKLKGRESVENNEIVNELRQRVNEKTKEITVLNQDKEELLKEIDDLKQNIYIINTDKTREISKLTKEIRELKQKNEIIESEKSFLQQDSIDISSKITSAMEIENKLKQDIKNLKTLNEKIKNENDSLKEENDILVSKLTAVEADKSLVTELEVLKIHIKQFESDKAYLQQENEELNKKISSLMESDNKHRKDLKNLREQYEQIKHENEQIHTERLGLSVRLTESDKRLANEIQYLKGQINSLEEEKGKLQRDNEELENKISSGLESENKLRYELKQMRGTNEHIENENVYLQQENQSLVAKISALEADKRVSREMENLKLQTQETEEEKVILQQEIEDLTTKLSTALEAGNKLRQEIKNVIIEYEKLKYNNENLYTENDELRARISELENDKKSAREAEVFKSQNKQIEKEKSALQEENQKLKAKNTFAMELEGKLMEEIRSLKAQLEKIKNENNELYEDNNNLEEKMKALRSDNTLKNEIERLRRQIEQMEKERLSIEQESLNVTARFSVYSENENAQKQEIQSLKEKVEQMKNERENEMQEKKELLTKISSKSEIENKLREQIKDLQNKIGQMKGRIEDKEQLQNEKEELENRLDLLVKNESELKGELRELKLKIEQMRNKIEDLQHENEILRSEIPGPNPNMNETFANENYKEEYEKLKIEWNSYRKENKLLSTKISELEEELRNVQSGFNELKRQNASNKILIEHITKEKDDIISSNNNYDSQIEEYKKKIFDQGHEVQKLKEQLKRIQVEKESTQKRNTELTNSIELMKREFENQKKDLQEKYEDLEENYHAFIEETQKTTETLKNQLKESGNKKAEGLTRRKVEQPLRWDRDFYEESSRDETNITNSTIEHIKEDYEKELNKLREQLKSAEKNKNRDQNSQRIIEKLEHELEMIKEENENIVMENNKLKEKIKFREQSMLTELSSFKKGMDNQTREIASELELTKRSVEIKDAKIHELNEEIQYLNTQIEELKNKDKLTRRTFSTSSPENKFNNELEQLRISEKNLRRQNSEYREENQRLKKEVELIQEYANVIQCDENTLNELTKENEELKKKLKEATKLSSANTSSPTGSDNEDSKRTLKELQRNYMRTQDTLSVTKMELAACQRQKEDLEASNRSQNEKISRLSDSLSKVEKEVVAMKQKTGEIIDLVIESGKLDLVDRIYAVVSH